MYYSFYQLIHSLQICIEENALQGRLPEEDLKRYLDWLNQKTNMFFSSKNIDVPYKFLPRQVKSHQYARFQQNERNIIDLYYTKKTINKDEIFFLDTSKVISKEHRFLLAQILVLQRKHVVWIDFGTNIGSEFSGKHPALILRNVGDNLLVVPLSSQTPTEQKDFHVKVEKVFTLPQKVRWLNIHRIIPISIKRVDFNSPHGDVKVDVLTNISLAIAKCGIR